MNGSTESELLEAFIGEGSEAAFNELIQQHVDLVYSAAVRITGNEQLAQDAVQFVFVALAKDARSVLPKLKVGAPLSGWLHTTARNVASKLVRTEVRRRAREKEALSMSQFEMQDAPDWEEIAPHLDAALGTLKEDQRHVLLLRFFERKTAKEIAAKMGLSEEAIQKRATRALESLRQSLRKRGLVVPGNAILAGLLTANASQAAPALLAAGVGKAVLSAHVATVGTAGTWIQGFFMTKTQISASAALLAAFVIPLSVQQSTIRHLEASQAQPPDRLITEPQTSSGNESLSTETEDAEIRRLRGVADDLKARLAEQRQRRSGGAQTATPVFPIVLTAGKAASIFDLTFAGNATPEAALQSFLTYIREGDLTSAASLMLIPPRNAEKMLNVLASDEQRHAMAEQMRNGLLGAVISEKVERSDDNHSTSEPVIEEVWPDNPSGDVTVELLEKHQLDDRRVNVRVRITRGAEVKTEDYVFGHTSTGWKQIFQ